MILYPLGLLSTVNQSTGLLVRTLGFRSKMDSAEGLVDNLDLGPHLNKKTWMLRMLQRCVGCFGMLRMRFLLGQGNFPAISPTPGRRTFISRERNRKIVKCSINWNGSSSSLYHPLHMLSNLMFFSVSNRNELKKRVRFNCLCAVQNRCTSIEIDVFLFNLGKAKLKIPDPCGYRYLHPYTIGINLKTIISIYPVMSMYVYISYTHIPRYMWVFP